MEIIKYEPKGLYEFVPKIFEDERGRFFESFNKTISETIGNQYNFVQDNQSYSKKNVLRGLHYQKKPNLQGKLVRTILGKVIDVAVDIRQGSPTYGKVVRVELDAEKGNMLFVPPGFAHGFKALTDCVFVYKCTDYYNKETEAGIIWNDKDLNIDWGNESPVLSDKDELLPSFKEIEPIQI